MKSIKKTKIRSKSANKKKLIKAGVMRKQAHTSSRNKRTQARRDRKGR